MKKCLLIVIVLLFVPYLYRPYALNLDGDTMTQLMDIVRLIDARWSFSLDPSAAYANPLVQVLVVFHGIYRHVILFPILYILDALGMGIREATLGVVFVGMGVVLTLILYRLMKSIIGSERAWWWTALFAVIPIYALQVKGAWWHLFIYTFFWREWRQNIAILPKKSRRGMRGFVSRSARIRLLIRRLCSGICGLRSMRRFFFCARREASVARCTHFGGCSDSGGRLYRFLF